MRIGAQLLIELIGGGSLRRAFIVDTHHLVIQLGRDGEGY
jgi:hypothetical protein